MKIKKIRVKERLLLWLLLMSFFVPVQAANTSVYMDDYALIEEMIRRTDASELCKFGYNSLDAYWISSPINSYEISGGVCRAKDDVTLYPIVNREGKCVFWAVVLDCFGEKRVCISSECTDIISTKNQFGKNGIALVYEDENLNIWNGEDLIPYQGNNLMNKDILSFLHGKNAPIKVRTVSKSHRIGVAPNSLRGEDDCSAYVNVPVIRQLTNSNWCWAACMASIVNHEKGYHYSCQGMANLYTTDQLQGANDYVVQSRLQGFGIHMTLVNPFSNPSLLPILSSISRGHPCYAKFTLVGGNEDHAVVIRGINFDSASVSIMNPHWSYTQAYHIGGIWQLQGDSGVVRYYQINTGEIYMMVTFMHQ